MSERETKLWPSPIFFSVGQAEVSYSSEKRTRCYVECGAYARVTHQAVLVGYWLMRRSGVKMTNPRSIA
jgi:hypothetical protein